MKAEISSNINPLRKGFISALKRRNNNAVHPIQQQDLEGQEISSEGEEDDEEDQRDCIIGSNQRIPTDVQEQGITTQEDENCLQTEPAVTAVVVPLLQHKQTSNLSAKMEQQSKDNSETINQDLVNTLPPTDDRFLQPLNSNNIPPQLRSRLNSDHPIIQQNEQTQQLSQQQAFTALLLPPVQQEYLKKPTRRQMERRGAKQGSSVQFSKVKGKQQQQQQLRQINNQAQIIQNNTNPPQDLHDPLQPLQKKISENKTNNSNDASKPSWNVVNRVRLVLKFMRELKRASNYHSLTMMKAIHYTIINDLSYIDHNKSSSSYFVSWMILFNKLRVFSPDNILLILFYNVLVLAVTLSLGFSQTIVSSFELSVDSFEGFSSSYGTFKIISSVILLSEIALRFNTAVYLEGNIVFNRLQIIRHYASTIKLLFIDLATCIPLLLQIETTNQLLSILLFFLRWVKIYRLSVDLNDHFRIWYRFPVGWIILKLLIMIITMAHFFGCQFYYIGRLQYESNNPSWLRTKNLLFEGWTVQYLNAFYFSVISTMTIGYGDIVPVTSVEKVYVTFVAVVGSCAFSYVVNTIGSIFQEISNKEAAFKQQKDNISDYMAKRKISQNLQLKVVKYLDYVNKKQSYGPLKGQAILNFVAKNLKDEVCVEYFGQILMNSPLFAINFSKEFLSALSLKLQEVMYGPGEIIFQKGELDCKIFFIQSGEIALNVEDDKDESKKQQQSAILGVKQINNRGNITTITKPLNKCHIFKYFLIFLYFLSLKKGQMFGQFGFFGQKPRETSVKCLEITDLVYLEIGEFLNVLQDFPEDFERYHMLKDEINFKDKKLNTKCSSCGSFDHTLIDCCLVKPQFNRFRIAIKHIYPVQQKRQAMFRESIKYDAYLNNYNVRVDLKRLRNNLTQRFSSPNEICEVSDENDDSEDDYEESQQQAHQNDDRQYFLKQKMQFQLHDGELVRLMTQNSQYLGTNNGSSNTNNINIEGSNQFQEQSLGSQPTISNRNSFSNTHRYSLQQKQHQTHSQSLIGNFLSDFPKKQSVYFKPTHPSSNQSNILIKQATQNQTSNSTPLGGYNNNMNSNRQTTQRLSYFQRLESLASISDKSHVEDSHFNTFNNFSISHHRLSQNSSKGYQGDKVMMQEDQIKSLGRMKQDLQHGEDNDKQDDNAEQSSPLKNTSFEVMLVKSSENIHSDNEQTKRKANESAKQQQQQQQYYPDSEPSNSRPKPKRNSLFFLDSNQLSHGSSQQNQPKQVSLYPITTPDGSPKDQIKSMIFNESQSNNGYSDGNITSFSSNTALNPTQPNKIFKFGHLLEQKQQLIADLVIEQPQQLNIYSKQHQLHSLEQQNDGQNSNLGIDNNNINLFLYDFDTMKEYKNYYPWQNFKKVIAASQYKRKPFVANKSIHNNLFIQKLVNKKKQIPRRLPSFMKQFNKQSTDSSNSIPI